MSGIMKTQLTGLVMPVPLHVTSVLTQLSVRLAPVVLSSELIISATLHVWSDFSRTQQPGPVTPVLQSVFPAKLYRFAIHVLKATF